MDDFTELQRLLRLKRHEAPPEDFFEDFMRDFHHAQRAEMLKRSVWRIALDRLESMWPVMSVGRYAYAGSCAVALVAAGLTSARILTTPAGVAVAENGGGSAAVAVLEQRHSTLPKVDFYSSRPQMNLADFNFENPQQPKRSFSSSAVSRPRYVLDSQPVRYEQPFSF